MFSDGTTATVGPRVVRRYRGRQTFKHVSGAQPFVDGYEDHIYGVPHDLAFNARQQVFPVSESVTAVTLSGSPATSSSESDTYAIGDATQTIKRVKFTGVTDQTLESTYEVDVWFAPRRQYVYPHLVVDDAATALPANSDLSQGRVDDWQMFRFLGGQEPRRPRGARRSPRRHR
jgi:hypothetical protein